MANSSSTETNVPPPLAKRPWRKWGVLILIALAGLVFVSWEAFVLSPEVRMGCVKALGLLGPRALPGVHEFLHDQDGHVSLAAAEILAQAGTDAVPTLQEGLSQTEADHRAQDVDLLLRIGPAAAAATPTLIELAGNDPDALVREHALTALAVIGPENPASHKALMHGLQDAAQPVRREAARSLGHIGPKARNAIPALANCLRDDPSREVRHAATVALADIGPDERSVKALTKALHDDADPFVRAEAAESLGTFGAEAKDAVLALAQSLKDPDERVRQESAEALGKIGRSARAAIPSLRLALRDPAERVAREAKDALAKIGE
jgi:HEAT repeat protein